MIRKQITRKDIKECLKWEKERKLLQEIIFGQSPGSTNTSFQ